MRGDYIINIGSKRKFMASKVLVVLNLYFDLVFDFSWWLSNIFRLRFR